MGVIIALIILNCQMHLNCDLCVDSQISCVDMLMSLKQEKQDPHWMLPYETKLAYSYEYCKTSEGRVFPEEQERYDALLEEFLNNPYAGFFLWEKPGYIANLLRQKLKQQ